MAVSGVTGRRGFIVGVSLSVFSLYGLWAVLDEGSSGHGAGGGHAGHGGGGLPVEEFRRLTMEFIAASGLPDGSVQPRPPAGMADHAEHADQDHDMSRMPIDVYLMASRWLFEPATLRLSVGQPYRLRMMAVDVAHGASIQLGRGSRMIRLPAGVLNEQVLTFTAPGEHLLYCTMFCGPGHDLMSGRILVT